MHKTQGVRRRAAAAAAMTAILAGCGAGTENLDVFERVRVGRIAPSWLAVARDARHTPFGVTFADYRDNHLPDTEELETYRFALQRGRVVAKSYTYRMGWLVGGYSQVRYRHILELEIPKKSFVPPPLTWTPPERENVLPAIRAAIADAAGDHVYSGNRRPPRTFADLRQLYFREVAGRAFARTLTRALSESPGGPAAPAPGGDADWQASMESMARGYRRLALANRRELQDTREQLIRATYEYEYAEDPARKELLRSVKGGLERKIRTLEQAGEQLESLLQRRAEQQGPRIDVARWQAARERADADALAARRRLEGNVAGFILTTNDLLGMLPMPPRPSSSIWGHSPWSRLWPQYELHDLLGDVSLNRITEDEFSRETVSPEGVRVKVTHFWQRRIRVEIEYHFYEYPVWE